MANDDYELVPGRIVSDLKRDMEELKRNPLGSTGSGKDLLQGIDNLNNSLSMMIDLFKEAAESLKLEEKEEEVLSKKIDPMIEKLDSIIEQNKKIAQGIVAIADMISEKLETLEAPAKPQQAPQQRQPEMQQQFGLPPMEEPMGFGQMPSMMPPPQPLPGMALPIQSSQSPFQFKPIGGNTGIEGKTGMPQQGFAPQPFPSMQTPEKPKKKGFGIVFK